MAPYVSPGSIFPIAAGVAGLSRGRGLPPAFFVQSNLSNYARCCPEGDFDRNYSVNFLDFAVLANHWLDEGCEIPFWCGKTDLDFSGTVETEDLGIFADNWLVGARLLQPVAHWKFDEGAGIVAHDLVGGNDGTIYGATWTTGQIDSALIFDGVDYIDCGNNMALNITKNVSIAAWIKFDDLPMHQTILAKRGLVSDSASNYALRTGRETTIIHNNDEFEFYYGSAPAWHIYTTSNVNLTVGNWYHVAVTFTFGSGSSIKCYVNGNLVSGSWTTGNGDSPVKINTNPLTIGGLTDDERINGTIDDVQLYNRALSAEEIYALYQNRASKKATDPNPADGTINIDPNTILSWSPGKDAVSHDVYLGTNFSDVNDGTEPITIIDANSYDPCGLEFATTYYWRIDQYDGTELHKGDVWSFTILEPDPNLVGWWKFDEGTGSIAT